MTSGLAKPTSTTTNGTHKRKPAPTSGNSSRPLKQLKPSPPSPVGRNGHSNGVEEDPDSFDGDDFELPEDGAGNAELQVAGKLISVAETREWQRTIEETVKSVVSIHFAQTCSFDTESALTSEATGFVVDTQRGYILTNRHVVGPGPFWGYAIFDNHEEVDVKAVYRDPVHDFGILQFDPAAIKYMHLEALELRPEFAKVGVEIRVVGNDAGEKLSILSGILSRTDRNAPDYGEGYCDFNTNYIQAAAAASGGSSGSPVVNIDGFAVALQAGGRSDGAATDYFLPLDRPARALQCIQAGMPVSRGTIQCQWLIKPFDECRRLGLSTAWEAAIRAEFPKATGMLVAEVVLPRGPSHTKIEEGDVLIRVNGRLLVHFISLDEILDASVGGKVHLLLQRGGQDVEVDLNVGDLHAITPDRFLCVAGATFHDLSYQQARLYNVAVGGVFVAEGGGTWRFDGTSSGWIVNVVDNKETPDLESFATVMKGIADRQRVVVKYRHLGDLHTQHTGIFLIDRHWASKMRMAIRNDVSGMWDFRDLADAIPAKTPEPRSADFVTLDGLKPAAAADIIKSFVRVSARVPLKIDGCSSSRKVGHGLVVDAGRGLVLVSRAIVPYDLCDVQVTIAQSIMVDAEVVFLHPIQGYAIVKYDPALVDCPVKSAILSETPIKKGAEPIFFGFNRGLNPVWMRTVVTDCSTASIPPSLSSPRFRALNLDAVVVDTGLAASCSSGALLADDGTVQAFWMTYLGERARGAETDYHLGMSAHLLLPVINQIRAGVVPSLRILNVETSTVEMSQARIMGLPEDWIQRVEREDPERHQLFLVRKTDCDHEGLEEADILLTLNGKLATRVDHLDAQYDNEELDAVVLREREVTSIKVKTIPTSDLNTSRAVIFCGAVLQPPHHAVRQQISKLHSDIYISGRIPGSPAYMYGLGSTQFITHVNGVATKTLDEFLALANRIPDNTYFRLKLVTFENVPWVCTLKKCEHYFPTMEFVKGDRVEDRSRNGWRRITYDDGGSAHMGDEPINADRVGQEMGGDDDMEEG